MLAAVLTLFAGVALAQSVLGPMIQLRSADESAFPAAAAVNVGGEMWGSDAGRVYASDGGSWQGLAWLSDTRSGFGASGTGLAVYDDGGSVVYTLSGLELTRSFLASGTGLAVYDDGGSVQYTLSNVQGSRGFLAGAGLTVYDDGGSISYANTATNAREFQASTGLAVYDDGGSVSYSCAAGSISASGCVSTVAQAFRGTKVFTDVVLDGGNLTMATGATLNLGGGKLYSDGTDVLASGVASFGTGLGSFYSNAAAGSPGFYVLTPGANVRLGSSSTVWAFDAGWMWTDAPLAVTGRIETDSLPSCSGTTSALKYDGGIYCSSVTTGSRGYDAGTGLNLVDNGSTVTYQCNTAASGVVGCVQESSVWGLQKFSWAGFLPAGAEAVEAGSTLAPRAGTTHTIVCGWPVAGLTGGGTDVVVARVLVNGAESCSCTLDLGCTTFGHGKCSCTGGTFAAADFLTVQLKDTTNCGTNPVNVHCNVLSF